MRVLFLSLFCLFCLFSHSTTVVAQDIQSLLPKIENAVSKEVPQYEFAGRDKFADTNEKENRKPKQSHHHWGTAKEGVSLTVFYADSQEEASHMFKKSVEHISAPPARELKDLGDEAYLWIGANNGYGTIQFRKNNIYMQLTATTAAMAQRLAQKLAEVVPKNGTQ